MRAAVKQKVHCSGSIRFLRERRSSGRAGRQGRGAGETSPGRQAQGRAGHHPPELHLPAEDGVGPAARVQPQEVRVPAEAGAGGERESQSRLRPRVCPRPPTHLVWKTSVKSCSRKSTREASLRISFTYTCTTTASGPFSYESFLTNARLTMGSGSASRARLSATTSPTRHCSPPYLPANRAAPLGLCPPSPTVTIHQGRSACCHCHLLFGTVTFLGGSAPGQGWRDRVTPGGRCLLSGHKRWLLLRAQEAGLGLQRWDPELLLGLRLCMAFVGKISPGPTRQVPPPLHCSPHPSPISHAHPALHAHLGGCLSQEGGRLALGPRAFSASFPLWPSSEMHSPLGTGPCLGPGASPRPHLTAALGPLLIPGLLLCPAGLRGWLQGNGRGLLPVLLAPQPWHRLSHP